MGPTQLDGPTDAYINERRPYGRFSVLPPPSSRMETLNLKTLANSLPTMQQKAEQELLNDFKGDAFFYVEK